MQLRKYQERTQAGIYAAWRDNKRVVAVLPTGAGKTVTGASVVRAAVAKGHSVIWLAHRTELLAQAKETIERLIGCSVGIIAAGEKPDSTAAVQVASIQTLLARKITVPAKLLVVDECHHIAEAAPEWASVLRQYKDSHWLGLTATPERGDGSGLAPLWGAIVPGAHYSELLTLGKLVPCRVLRPESGDSSTIAAKPTDAYRDHAMGTPAVVYAASVSDAEKYAAEFNAMGVSAACVHGKTADDVRKKILDDFKAGKIKVLTNVYVLTEGWDAPNARTCIIARGCGSAGAFLQMVGRVMRPDPSDPGKTDCLLIDLSGVSEIHGHPQADREYSLDGLAIELKEKAESRKEKDAKERDEKQAREERTKEILERGLTEMSPLGLEARKEWEKLQRVCKERQFSVQWAQLQFRTQFGSKPPVKWINDELQMLEFRKLQQNAHERGFNPKWAAVRYKGIFGKWPGGVRK